MSKKFLRIRQLFSSTDDSRSKDSLLSNRFRKAPANVSLSARRLGMEALENRELLNASSCVDVPTENAPVALVSTVGENADIEISLNDLTLSQDAVLSAAVGDAPQTTGKIADVSAANGATVEIDLAQYFSEGDWNYSFQCSNAASDMFAAEPTIENGKLTLQFIGNDDYGPALDLNAVEFTVSAASKTDASAVATANDFSVSLTNAKTATLQAVLSTLTAKKAANKYDVYAEDDEDEENPLGYGAETIPESQLIDADTMYLQLWAQDVSSKWGVVATDLTSFQFTVHISNATPDASVSTAFGQMDASIAPNADYGDGYYKIAVLYKTGASCLGIDSARIIGSLKLTRTDATQPVVVELLANLDDRDPAVSRLVSGDSEGRLVHSSQVEFVGAANAETTPLESLVLSNAAPEVGAVVTTTLTPEDATADYQWFRVDAQGIETAVQGADAATYQVVAEDAGYYLKVVATGNGEYTGTVSAKTTSVVSVPLVELTGIVLSNAAPEVGAVVTTTLTPENATADYQWFRVDAQGIETAVQGADAATYQVVAEDAGYYLKVVATGNGEYTGTVSAKTTSVVATEATLTKVYLTTNYPRVGIDVSVKNLAPEGATADYQWFRVAENGVATPIQGANVATYTPGAEDVGFRLKIVATGNGNYSGSAEFTTKDPVKAVATVTTPLTKVYLTTNYPRTGYEIAAKNLAPEGATADYQWFRVAENGVATPIQGANAATYVPGAEDVGFRLKIVATGNGSYSGSVEFTTKDPVKIGLPVTTPLTKVYLTTNYPRTGWEVAAKNLGPEGATADYQWFRVAENGVATPIQGANAATYIPGAEDVGFRLKIVATGNGSYSGSVEFTTKDPVKIGLIVTTPLTKVYLTTNYPRTGYEVAAKSLAPEGATADYQWFRVAENGVATPIQGANAATYVPGAEDVGFRLKIVATGNGSYSGSVEFTTKDPVKIGLPVAPVTTPLTKVYLTTNYPRTGWEIATKNLAPEGATADYQWFRVAENGVATPIQGANAATYTPGAEDVGFRLKLVATGNGNYSGSVEFTTIDPVIVPASVSSATLESEKSDFNWDDVFADADDDEFWTF